MSQEEYVLIRCRECGRDLYEVLPKDVPDYDSDKRVCQDCWNEYYAEQEREK